MLKLITLIYLVSYTCVTWGEGCLEKTSWSQCREVEDIQVCSSKIGTSETLAYKGEAIILAPLKQLVPVFYDVEHYKDWQINVKEIQVVRDVVPPGETACLVERIEHSYGKKPWLVRWVFWIPDSDFVYKASYHLTPDGKHFALYLENEDSQSVPEVKKYRRGTVQTCYILDSTENINESRLRVEIWVDLNLDLDSSRINSNLKDWPINMIKGLRKHVKKPGLQTDVQGLDVFLDQCLINDVIN